MKRHVLSRLLAVSVAAVALGVVGRDVPSAGAAGSRAVVNIGGSNQVVSFGTTVTGLQALRMVASVTTIGFGGSGEAVCAINGVGNPATPDQCLVGPNGEYWSYWRAGPGATAWQYSSRGAGATSVTDGSVEGWRYGTGGPPPFTSFCAVAGCAPPPTAAAPPTVAPGGGSATGVPGTSAGGTAPTSTTVPGGVGTSSADDTEVAGATSDRTADGSGDGDGTQAAGRAARGGADGGSPAGIAAVGGVVAVLATGGFALRRRRRPAVPG